MNKNLFDGKVILITGGTGSLGKTIVHHIMSGHYGIPKQVIVFSRDEAKQHHMRLSYLHKKHATDEVIYNQLRERLVFRIGDVRSYDDIKRVLPGADIVINAAALKQVPTCEYFPEQAIQTNCIGAINLAQAIIEGFGSPEAVVAISTDKACKPVNVMGMTKAIQERIIATANVYSAKTRFLCVRYGNVLASRGSVTLYFIDQIRKGEAVTITDKRMTRFLLSLDDAVNTVFAVLEHGNAGETFVPRIRSAKITDVAEVLIDDRDIKVQFTEIRPGEKIHEIMISEEETARVGRRGGYYVIRCILPEVADRVSVGDEPYDLKGEYSSSDHTMDRSEIHTLLERNNLRVSSARGASEDLTLDS